MKLFNENQTSIKKGDNLSIKNNRKSKKIAKVELSENEIREKINKAESTKVETSKLSQIKGQKLGEGFLNQSVVENKKIEQMQNNLEEVKTPNTSDYTVKSDVGVNSPLDTNTSEKLKTVISKGAFNFNSKERDVLEKILNDR